MDRESARKKAEEIMGTMISHERRERGWAYRHGLRTANLSLWLRARLFPGETSMDDILWAAGLFHDCAKDDEADHAQAGAQRALEYLRGIADGNELAAVKQTIYMHNKRGGNSSDMEKILQDADIIDHFGAIEVWLNVSYSVLGGEGPERSVEFYGTQWAGMVEEVRPILNFELSKAVFDDRVRFSEAFISRLRVEAAGGVTDFG